MIKKQQQKKKQQHRIIEESNLFCKGRHLNCLLLQKNVLLPLASLMRPDSQFYHYYFLSGLI